MNLSDNEILELTELCNALTDATITGAQKARLERLLAGSEEARRFYVRYLGLSASLFDYAGEMQAEEPDVVRPAVPRWRAPKVWWAAGSLAAAAALVLSFWLGGLATTEPDADEFVARLTGAKDCQWIGGAVAVQLGDHLRKGQRLELAKGVAEITFDCGAQVTLEAPAALDVNSAWDATLRHGTLKASVPIEAIGFRVAGPTVNVVDLGTEFSMVTDRGGATEVYVLKGAVEASARDASGGEREPVVLKEKQARRFGRLGMSEIQDKEQSIKRFAKAVNLDRFTRPIGFVRWSFDEADGRVAHAEASGMPHGSFDAQIESAAGGASSGLRTEGHRERALLLDGRSFAKAPFPGIATHAPRTVAFWVQMPPDAPLSDGNAIIVWGTKKSGVLPVQIGRNSNPAQGVPGALRTEFGRGFVVGTTPLHDGHWHHVTVVFVPTDRAERPMQVKQYIDGRLELATAKHVKKHRASVAPGELADEAAGDFVWIGRRPGRKQQSQERFRGALDELFIADRALAPREIVQLMKENKPPQPTAVAAQ